MQRMDFTLHGGLYMDAKSVYGQVSALLRDFLHPLGMLVEVGPLRTLRELTAGIVFTGSVQVTNAARLFASSAHSLGKFGERMSHHLLDENWDHRDWAAAVLQQLTSCLEEDDLIPLDGTELAKPYARHMEHLCTVRDASRVGDPLVNGYWCWGAYHWSESRQTLHPLMLRPWSSTQPDFHSENDLISRWMWTLRQATGGKGIWLIDRGADRPELLADLLRLPQRWIVRLRKDRPLTGPAGGVRSAGEWADWALANRAERGHAVTLPVALPPDQVRQPQLAPKLWLVVPTYTFCRDGKVDRWILLTRGLIDEHAGPRQLRHDYGLRWRAEDGKRFLGQVWHVERFLTRSFTAVERMLWCACLAGGFLSFLQREEPELSRELQEEVTYLNDCFKLPVYRLAHGLRIVAAQGGHIAMSVNA
jgi:hypothetical protein